MMGALYIIIAAFALSALLGYRNNPRRRKVINSNLTAILNAPLGARIELRHIPDEVEKEYAYQLHGYRHKYNMRCYRDPLDPNILILAKDELKEGEE